MRRRFGFLYTGTFGIPAGEPGVTDQITVVAMLSGRSASQLYTW